MTLDYKNGWLCLKMTGTKTFEPIRWTSWYPVFKASYDSISHLVGRGCTEYAGKYYNAGGFEFQLQNGGATKPLVYEEMKVELPKVRKGIETRWYLGRWEKLSRKERAWISV